MKWYTIIEKRPPVNEDILIKINESCANYYVATAKYFNYCGWLFFDKYEEEKSWFAADVQYWCSLNELDKTLSKGE